MLSKLYTALLEAGASSQLLLAWALAQLAKAPACWRCGVLLPEEGVPTPEDRCAACGADLVPF